MIFIRFWSDNRIPWIFLISHFSIRSNNEWRLQNAIIIQINRIIVEIDLSGKKTVSTRVKLWQGLNRLQLVQAGKVATLKHSNSFLKYHTCCGTKKILASFPCTAFRIISRLNFFLCVWMFCRYCKWLENGCSFKKCSLKTDEKWLCKFLIAIYVPGQKWQTVPLMWCV